jgi:cell division protein FtsQ
MARKEQEERQQPQSAWRYLSYFAAGTAALVFGILVFQRLEHYLITDPKFLLAAPAEYGEESASLHVEGVQHASRAQVMQTFSEDFGRSVYLFPIARRRMELLAVPWVKDASIMRIWPNKAAVRIVEREPVAFVPLKTNDPAAGLRTALIDDEGVILEPRGATRFHLPVLTGVQQEESRDLRRAKVRRMQKVLEEIGPLAEKLSEIDITSLDNVKVSLPVDSRAMILLLGNRHYQPKLENFFKHYPEIRKRLPDAMILDLRIEDRITAVEGGTGE